MGIKTNQEGQILRIILLLFNPISKGELMYVSQGLSVIVTTLLSQLAHKPHSSYGKILQTCSCLLALTAYSLPVFCHYILYYIERLCVLVCVFIFKNYIERDIPHIIPPNNPHKHKYTTNPPLAE